MQQKILLERKIGPQCKHTMSEDMEEQLKLAHKVVEVVDRANRKVCVTLLRYKVDKPENFYSQVRLVARISRTRSFNKLSM